MGKIVGWGTITKLLTLRTRAILLLLVLVILAVHTSADGTLRGARPMGAFFRGGSPPKEGRGPPPPTPLRGARPTPET